MARVYFDSDIEEIKLEEDRIQQGDFVLCEAIENSGAYSFWGIYSSGIGVIALNGGGNSYLPQKTDLYLHNAYNHWVIIKRIKCDNVELNIKEIIN